MVCVWKLKLNIWLFSPNACYSLIISKWSVGLSYILYFPLNVQFVQLWNFFWWCVGTSMWDRSLWNNADIIVPSFTGDVEQQPCWVIMLEVWSIMTWFYTSCSNILVACFFNVFSKKTKFSCGGSSFVISPMKNINDSGIVNQGARVHLPLWRKQPQG